MDPRLIVDMLQKARKLFEQKQSRGEIFEDHILTIRLTEWTEDCTREDFLAAFDKAIAIVHREFEK